MSEKFKKLKTKYLLGAILKSVILGLSVGVFATGATMLTLKLLAITLDMLWYVVIGVGSALVGGLIAFIFFRPTNKKVAKRLDNDFELEERVQTSLQYSGQEGTVVQLQREDAEQKLNTLPKAKFRLAGIWQFCLVAVIAIAMAFAAFFVPAKQVVAEKPEDPDFNPAVVTLYHVQSVQGIIDNVKASDLKDEVKADVVDELQVLLDRLEDSYYRNVPILTGQLNALVLNTVDSVEFIVNNSINYITLSDGITTLGAPDIGAVLMAGGNSYRTYEIKEYGHVETFKSQQIDATNNKIKLKTDVIQNSLNIKLADGLDEVLHSNAVSALTATDANKLGVDPSDPLYTTVSKFAQDLMKISQSVSRGEYDQNEGKISGDLNSIFESFKNSLSPELTMQSYTGAMRRYVGNKLKTVFGVGVVEEPDKDEGGEDKNEDGSKPEDNENNESGGGGRGDQRYGSDDEIYDPFTGMYVKYSTLLGKFKTLFNELVEKGELTAEQANMYQTYYDYLFGNKRTED